MIALLVTAILISFLSDAGRPAARDTAGSADKLALSCRPSPQQSISGHRWSQTFIGKCRLKCVHTLQSLLSEPSGAEVAADALRSDHASLSIVCHNSRLHNNVKSVNSHNVQGYCTVIPVVSLKDSCKDDMRYTVAVILLHFWRFYELRLTLERRYQNQ